MGSSAWKRLWNSSRSSICETVDLAASSIMPAAPNFENHSEL